MDWKKLALLVVVVVVGGWVLKHFDEIVWNGKLRTFVAGPANDAALVLQALPNDSRAAIDVRPTEGTRPQFGAWTEVVLYRSKLSEPMERMNWSAMNASDPMYRFGVERGAGGSFHPVCFAFEDVAPGVARVPLCIAPPEPALGTQLMLEVSVDGAYSFRQVELGPPDSGGVGYRALRVAN